MALNININMSLALYNYIKNITILSASGYVIDINVVYILK